VADRVHLAVGYAKVNLTLEVLGRRDDGYHDLATCFLRLQLADRVEVRVTPRREPDLALGCRVVGRPVEGGAGNLAWRAAEALYRYAAPPGPGGGGWSVSIRLTKTIPVAAGLAGGSADAAATLLALDRAWDLGLGVAGLEPVARSLGADVPFALWAAAGTRAAVGRGRGDRLEPVQPGRTCWVVLVDPGLGLGTARVFAHYPGPVSRPPGAPPPGAATDRVARALAEGDIGQVAAGLCNDLEAVTFSLVPGLAELKAKLLAAGALGAAMSGSGPSLFGLAGSRRHAREVAGRLGKLVRGSLAVRVVAGR